MLSAFQTCDFSDLQFGNGHIAVSHRQIAPILSTGQSNDFSDSKFGNDPIAVSQNEIAPIVSTDYLSKFLDTKFGDGGIAIDPQAPMLPFALTVATQADGKTVIFGTDVMNREYPSFLTRFNTDGTLDKTFGNGGTIYITSLTHDANLMDSSLVVQPDGRIVVVGVTHQSNRSAVLLRFNADGSPDASFGIGGKVVTDFGAISGGGTAIIMEPDGKLLEMSTGNTGIAMARYNADGTLDSTFGIGGIVVDSNMLTWISSLQLQSDGKILIGGGRGSSGAALIRLNADGTRDSTFGVNGEVLYKPDPYNLGDIAIQSDGKILAIANGVIIRFNSDGSLDRSFGQNGTVTQSLKNISLFSDYRPRSLLVQPDGRIFVGSPAGVTCYNTDGVIDATFGDGGTISYDGLASVSNGIAISGGPDGSIVVAGGMWDTSAHTWHTVLVRFNTSSSDPGKAAMLYAPAARSSQQQIEFLSTCLQPGMSLFTPFDATNDMGSFSQWQPFGLNADLSSGVISGNTVGFDKQPLWTIASADTSRLNSDSVDAIFSDTFGVVGNSLETDSLLSLVDL